MLNNFGYSGALSGFISSIALAFWMSFGQPKPMPKKLSLSRTEPSIVPRTAEVDIVIKCLQIVAVQLKSPKWK